MLPDMYIRHHKNDLLKGHRITIEFEVLGTDGHLQHCTWDLKLLELTQSSQANGHVSLKQKIYVLETFLHRTSWNKSTE